MFTTEQREGRDYKVRGRSSLGVINAIKSTIRSPLCIPFRGILHSIIKILD